MTAPWSAWTAGTLIDGTIERGPMQFVLRYRGKVPSGSKRKLNAKQAIRLHLHPQLKELCRTDFFSAADARELPIATLKGRRMEDDGISRRFRRVVLNGVDYVPIIHHLDQLCCELDILWLRRQQPGDIFSENGDLDNSLKNLMDGLRMPHDDDEAVCEGVAEGDRVFCLLEDDSLITKFSVTTQQLLEPLGPEAEDDLLIQVSLLNSGILGPVTMARWAPKRPTRK